MSEPEPATLFLLKDKLERVRKDRRNSQILLVVFVVASALIANFLNFNFFIAFIMAVALATVA